jgi:hypothetical protein
MPTDHHPGAASPFNASTSTPALACVLLVAASLVTAPGPANAQQPEDDTARTLPPASAPHTARDVGRIEADGFELQASLGAAVTDLEVAGGNLVREEQRVGVGGALGLAAGFRLGQVFIGPRLTLQLDPSIVLGHAALGAEWRVLAEDVSPFLRAAFGGTFVVPHGDTLAGQRGLAIGGIGLELAAGMRWRIGEDGLLFGVELAGTWHHLWRQAVPACVEGCSDEALDLLQSGEGDALSGRLSLIGGWAF